MLQDLFIEQRSVGKTSTLSQDVAHHLFTRQSLGRAVIVTERPSGFMGAVKKQWAKVIMQVQNERSRTLDQQRIAALGQQAGSMQDLEFSTQLPAGSAAEVLFLSTQQLLDSPVVCQTMYITPVVTEAELVSMTSAMPPHSLVVVYTDATAAG